MKMRLIAAAMAVIALPLVAWLALRRPAAPERFVLIVVDSLRADCLGCYGSHERLTPSLDALAARGVRFAQCWSASSWTIESNSGLFTSRYPSEVRTGNGMHLLDRALTTAEAFRAAGYSTAAFSSHPLISPDFGFGQGFNTFRLRGHQEDRTAADCLAWIKEHRRDRYFVLLSLYAPHFPYRPAHIPAALGARLAALPKSTRDGYIPTSGENRLLRIVPKATGKQDEASLEQVAALRDLYALYVREVDARVGRILQVLRDDPQCVVAITADHGEEFLEHGYIYHQLTLYSELLHVPLIISAPGVAPAAVETPVSGLDVMPTFLALGRITPPRNLAGKRLFPTADIGNRVLFSEIDWPRKSVVRYGARAGDTAVVYSLSGCPPEKPIPREGRWDAYDLKHDPMEKHPVSAAPPRLRQDLVKHTHYALAARRAAAKEKPTPEAQAGMMRQLRSLGYLGPH
jgi:arylsulfatase A-like enzyme